MLLILNPRASWSHLLFTRSPLVLRLMLMWKSVKDRVKGFEKPYQSVHSMPGLSSKLSKKTGQVSGWQPSFSAAGSLVLMSLTTLSWSSCIAHIQHACVHPWAYLPPPHLLLSHWTSSVVSDMQLYRFCYKNCTMWSRSLLPCARRLLQNCKVHCQLKRQVKLSTLLYSG